MEGKNCRPFNNDIKLHLEKANSYFYPDVSVVCGKVEYSESEPEAVTNPTVIVEVLSNSTAAFDRGKKFMMYRKIPSLQEYVLVDQYECLIDIYQRRGDLWKIKTITAKTQHLKFESLGVAIALKDIYQNVRFPD